MNRGLMIGAVLTVLFVGAWGCSKGEGKGSEKTDTLQSQVAVEATPVQGRDLVEAIEVVGALSPKYEAKIRPEFAGIVTEVYVSEWVRVKKGTPLAKMDTREIEAIVQKAQAAVEVGKATLAQAEVGGNRAERELQRALNLKEAGLITQQLLDDAKTEKAASLARIAAARAQLLAAEKDLLQAQTRLSKSLIRSPMDGIVFAKNVNVGDLVGEPGSQRLLFQIVDNRLLELTVTVPSSEMARLKIGQPLNFTADAFPGKTFSGRIKYINPTVNEADRSVKVIAEVPNSSETLKAGLFVKGRIITGQRHNVLQIPKTALLSWDVGAQKGEVYIIEKGLAQRKTIQTGGVSGDWIEVVSGLQPGTPTITRGGFNVKNGDRVKITQLNGGN